MSDRSKLVIGLIAVIGLYLVGLGPLETTMAPRGHGIVDLELSWTPTRLQQILSDWGAIGLDAAKQQIWWDFAFVPAYCLMIVGALRLVLGRAQGALARWAKPLTMGVLVAGALDYLENISMLIALNGSHALIGVASAFASVKFVLLVAAVIALVWGMVSTLVHRFKRA